MKSLDTTFPEFDIVFSLIPTILSILAKKLCEKQSLLTIFLRPNLKYT